MKKLENSLIGPIFLYLAIAIFYTFPLILKISTHLPSGSADVPIGVWDIWHFKKVIFSPWMFSWKSPYIFFPQNPSLAYHTYIVATGLLSLPFQLFFSPLTSYNLTCFVQFLLTAMGMYKLSYILTNNKISALWSGLAFAFCPYVMIQSIDNYNYPTIWFFPWFTFFLYKFLSTKKIRYSCACILVYTLCLFNNLVYFVQISILGFLICILFFFKNPKDLISKKVFVFGLSGIILFIILAFSYLIKLKYEYADLIAENWPIEATEYFSLRIWQLFTPLDFYTVYSKFPFVSHRGVNSPFFLGYLSIVLAFFGITYVMVFSKDKKLKQIALFCIIVSVIFFCLAVGPYLLKQSHFLNKFALYNLFFRINLLKQFRTPMRFVILGTFSFYMLTALGIKYLLEMNKVSAKFRKFLGFTIIFLQIVEFTPQKYPLYKVETDKTYKEISKQQKKSPILILPLGWSSAYKIYGVDPRPIQYAQTLHQRPIFHGHIARLKKSYFDYYLTEPGFKNLMEISKGLTKSVEVEPVFKLIERFAIEDVIIYKRFYSKEQIDFLIELFKRYPAKLNIKIIE